MPGSRLALWPRATGWRLLSPPILAMRWCNIRSPVLPRISVSCARVNHQRRKLSVSGTRLSTCRTTSDAFDAITQSSTSKGEASSIHKKLQLILPR